MTPAEGALTSTVTLSVSSSTSGSSAATCSPACLSQRATVALLTLSPRVGTTISVIVLSLPLPRAPPLQRQRLAHQTLLLLPVDLG